MSEKPIIHIFHLKRIDGKPVFYHPFLTSPAFIDQLKESNIVGRYGEEPRVESLTLLRNDLYLRAEKAVNLWIADLRFIPRFLISSAVFLLVYFFMSYVVRDPIPMIDEILLGFGGAAAVYYFLGRRYLNSDVVTGKRIELRAVIGGIAFSESEFIRKIEAVLGSYDEAGPAEQLKIYGSEEKLALDPAWREEALALHRYLDARFANKDAKSFRRKLQNRVNLSASKPLEKLKKLIEADKIDFPLFLVYIALHRGLE